MDERSGVEQKRPDNHKLSAVPPASALLQQLAQCSGIALSVHRHRKLGLPSSDRQDVIGRLSGQLIGSAPDRDRAFNTSRRAESSRHPSRPTISAISSDLNGSPTRSPPGQCSAMVAYESYFNNRATNERLGIFDFLISQWSSYLFESPLAAIPQQPFISSPLDIPDLRVLQPDLTNAGEFILTVESTLTSSPLPQK